jgi:ribosomal protein L1
LEANLKEIIKAVGRQNIKNLVISTTMGPGITVKVD